MSKFNHSVGPWFYTGSCVWGVTRDSNGDPEQYQIADSGEWDARLIACAPEMLNVLIENCNRFKILYKEEWKNFIEISETIKLIEKATGINIDEVLK